MQLPNTLIFTLKIQSPKVALWCPTLNRYLLLIAITQSSYMLIRITYWNTISCSFQALNMRWDVVVANLQAESYAIKTYWKLLGQDPRQKPLPSKQPVTVVPQTQEIILNSLQQHAQISSTIWQIHSTKTSLQFCLHHLNLQILKTTYFVECQRALHFKCNTNKKCRKTDTTIDR